MTSDECSYQAIITGSPGRIVVQQPGIKIGRAIVAIFEKDVLGFGS